MPSATDALLEIGRTHPREHRAYVAKFGLSQADEPALLELVRRWADEDLFARGEDDPVAWAPVHAWRALAELGSTQVVSTMLDMLDVLHTLDDQWYLEEFPSLCERVGHDVLGELEIYLLDSSHCEFPRVAVAHAMEMIAKFTPELRDRVVDVLAKADTSVRGLNAFVITYMLSLGARDHAELIERAFDAGAVDPLVRGDWPDIAYELGVGPRPPKRPNPFAEMFDRALEGYEGRAREQEPMKRPVKQQAKPKKTRKSAMAARKRQKQARRKNRRRQRR